MDIMTSLKEVYYIALPLDEIRRTYIEVNGSDKNVGVSYHVPDNGSVPEIWICEFARDDLKGDC